MEENNNDIQQAPELSPAAGTPQNISLSDALAGVFSEPGETFTEVKRSTRSTYWLLPLIIIAFITALASFIVLNDEELSSEIKKTQMDAVKEKLDEAVKEGKITREQANEQLEQTQKMFSGVIFTAIGIAGGFFGVIFIFFILSLIYWLVFKMFKGGGSFINFMNVLGLASIITSIQVIINSVLAIFMGRIYVNLGPVWLFTEEQLGKGLFKFVASFDLLTIWYLAVISIGFAKVSELKTSVTMPVVYGLWLVWALISSFVLTTFVGM